MFGIVELICANIVIYFLLSIMKNFCTGFFGQQLAEEEEEKNPLSLELEG